MDKAPCAVKRETEKEDVMTIQNAENHCSRLNVASVISGCKDLFCRKLLADGLSVASFAVTAARIVVFAVSLGLSQSVFAEEGFKDFTVPGLPAPVHYFAQHSFTDGDSCETAVVIVHGWGDGVILPLEVPSFYRAAKRIVGKNGKLPYVVAPVFPRKGTLAKFFQPDDGRARWNDSMLTSPEGHTEAYDEWSSGGDAAGVALSSFDVIDGIFDAFSNTALYPNLKRVVLAGFSAGGQFSWRYAAVGKGMSRPGVTLEFAPMAPSTVFRLDSEVKWKYGLKNRSRYAAALTEEQIRTNLETRRVWFGCGAQDVLKKPQTALDDSPEASAQGENRYDRFLKFREYLAKYPAWAKQVSFHTFPELGHAYRQAFTDDTLVRFILGWRLRDFSKVSIIPPKGNAGASAVMEAVEELKNGLRMLCDASVEDGAPLKFVFARPDNAPPPRPFESRYRISGDTVWFWGDDESAVEDGKTISRRGTFFAVSLFLEKELGFKWLWPGEDGIDVERRNEVALAEEREMAFETRLLKSTLRNPWRFDTGKRHLARNERTPKAFRDLDNSYKQKSHDERAVWLLRQRLQSRARFSYGHAFTKWKKLFFKEHPEYFNWNAERKDRGWTGSQGDDRTKRCVSNEGNVDLVISEWLKNGTNAYLNVCENDGGFFCQCAECRALDVVRPDVDIRDMDHLSDRYCDFWNRIAQKARAIRPDVTLVTYAYARYRTAPRRLSVKYPDNMLFGFVPSLMDDAQGEFLKWKECGMKHYFLRPNYHHYYGSIPRGMERVIYEDFQRHLANGMVGVDYDMPSGKRGVLALENYVTARVVADPDLGFDEICEEFYSGFGAAAPAIRRYFEAVRNTGEKARESFLRDVFPKMRILDDSKLSRVQCHGHDEAELIEKCNILESASGKYSKALSPKRAKRLESLRLQAVNALLAYRFLVTSANNLEDQKRAGKVLKKFRKENRDYLDDDWPMVFGSLDGEGRAWLRIENKNKKGK